MLTLEQDLTKFYSGSKLGSEDQYWIAMVKVVFGEAILENNEKAVS